MGPDMVRMLRTLQFVKTEQLTQLAWRSLRPRPAPATPPSRIDVRLDAWPRTARASRATHSAVLDGEFEFWGAKRRLDLTRAWSATDLGLSWQYPVHYFDAAPGLARTDPVRLCGWIDQWIAAHPAAEGVAWEAYPASLRIVNWFEALAILGPQAPQTWRARVLHSLWRQADWLAKNVEWHRLGTHLFKNGKALAIAGRVFTDSAATGWRRASDEILTRVLAQQLWPDGGLGEPSLTYHNLALEDVLDLLALRDWEQAPWAGLARENALRMLRFACAVQTPQAEAPLRGDCGEESVPSTAALAGYAARLGLPAPEPGRGVQLFAGTGVAVYRDARQYLVAAAGSLGLPHLPGHSHCDALSFEWWVEDRPIVVDTGTISYEPGAARFATRSTAAHNTLQVDGEEHHEIWGEWRVARRSHGSVSLDVHGAVVAELVPWFDRRLRITRRFECSPAGIRIDDAVTGPGQHTLTSRVHLHPDCTIERNEDTVVVRHGPATAVLVMPVGFRILEPAVSGSVHCERPGVARANTVLELESTGMLPWAAGIRLE